MPFAAAKRVVDVDRCRDIVDEVRNNLPETARQQKIVADREQILNAQTDADNIIKQAEERARVLVSDKEITKRTEDGRGAGERRTGTGEKDQQCLRGLCENILKNFGGSSGPGVADIKNTRMNLRNLASRGPHGPQKPNL